MKDNCPTLMQSEEKDAPWNMQKIPTIEVDCCVSYCISKTMPVNVSSYRTVDGEADLEDTNLIEEFGNDTEAMGIPTLISELKHLAEKEVERLQEELHLCDFSNRKAVDKIKREINYYKSIVAASKGWNIDDFAIEKE